MAFEVIAKVRSWALEYSLNLINLVLKRTASAYRSPPASNSFVKDLSVASPIWSAPASIITKQMSIVEAMHTYPGDYYSSYLVRAC